MEETRINERFSQKFERTEKKKKTFCWRLKGLVWFFCMFTYSNCLLFSQRIIVTISALGVCLALTKFTNKIHQTITFSSFISHLFIIEIDVNDLKFELCIVGIQDFGLVGLHYVVAFFNKLLHDLIFGWYSSSISQFRNQMKM